jgi:hypothetical protein
MTKEKKESSDIEKIKKFLLELNFICHSQPSSQNQIFSKEEDIIIIKRK